MMAYAFYFDSSSCTGCKACQVACKDKNNLSLGVLWRRVYEVSGGEWKRAGEAWTSNVYAYNLSLACNHCVHPKCAGVCPVDAYVVRPDGIVTINTQKCIGCGYCAWACPYDAPKLDGSAGVMTKCNLCYDYIDIGLPPACVAACPLRCLDLVNTGDQAIEKKGQVLWNIPGESHPFPLPVLSRTEPHLIIKPHPGMKLVGINAEISNREETSPSHPKVTAIGEIPLIIFTLLAQMSIGAFGAIFIINLGSHEKQLAVQMTRVAFLAVGLIILMALASSLFHLRTPNHAWRAIFHIRKSWLSREILFTLGFAGLWSIQAGLVVLQPSTTPMVSVLGAFTIISGLAALFCMQRVYQLRNMRAWNSLRTLEEFTISAVGLGCWLTGSLLLPNAPPGILVWIGLGGNLAFLASILILISYSEQGSNILRKWRFGLLLAGLLGGISLITWLHGSSGALWYLVLIIALVEETIGRWLFYLRRNPGI